MRCRLPLLTLALVPILPCLAQEATPIADDKASAQLADRATAPQLGYPRPMLMRSQWTNLDGEWEYAITEASPGAPDQWQGKITVPSAVESADSGVQRSIGPNQQLWYHRSFGKPDLGVGERMVLHFGAVSSEASVWVNGNLITAHRGANAPFSVDITAFLTETPIQELVVGVSHARPADEHRPALTGITGTAWLEVLPHSHIKELRLSPDTGRGTVTVFVGIWGQANFRQLEIIALDGDQEVAKGAAFYHYEKGGYETTLTIPEPKLWSPDSPKLYGMRIRIANEDGTTHDSITSYFALRDASIIAAPGGRQRFALNGKPLFLLGVTEAHQAIAADDAGIRVWIEAMKTMGFNSVRVSGGLASPRFYHWADRLGLLVWQDVPGPDGTPSRSLGASSGTASPPVKQWIDELSEIKTTFQQHPSIIIWPDRSPHAEGGGDVFSSARRASLGLGEDQVGTLLFVRGHPGVAMPLPHGDSKTALAVVDVGAPAAALTRDRYASSIEDMRKLIGAGLSGAYFSRRPDAELDQEWIAATNATLDADLPTTTLRILLETGANWHYTVTRPPETWPTPGFDDSSWKSGAAPFGDPKAKVQTAWTGDRLWLRQGFSLEAAPAGDLCLKIINSERTKIYLNGEQVADCSGASSSYRLEPLPADAASLLTPGENTIAIEIENSGHLHFFDAGLAELRP